jgi:hypothetical protein
LDYLDRFVDIREQITREHELRDLLLELQSKIEDAIRKVELIPQYQRDLALTQSQIRAAEKVNAKEVIGLQRKVELERQIRNSIVRNTQAIVGGVSQQGIKENIQNLKNAADPKTLVAGLPSFQQSSPSRPLLKQTLRMQTMISRQAVYFGMSLTRNIRRA